MEDVPGREDAAKENRHRKCRPYWAWQTCPRSVSQHIVPVLLDNRVLIGETRSEGDAQPIQ